MQKKLDQKKLLEFKNALQPFLDSPRQFPWRNTADPYAILVSEIMLQQTQTSRVVEKYTQFLETFPTVHALAAASAKAVLSIWSGLGYNRRALFLKRAAEGIVLKHGGTVPNDPELLELLPGIGHYTARAIVAFAFNKAYPFLETNVRSVYLHHFFSRARKPVPDAALLSLVESTMDTKNPRAWSAAIMDYGAYLKANGNKIHQKSKSYTKQSTFKGSNRQIRGQVLRLLLEKKRTEAMLLRETKAESEKVRGVIAALVREGMLKKVRDYYTIL